MRITQGSSFLRTDYQQIAASLRMQRTRLAVKSISRRPHPRNTFCEMGGPPMLTFRDAAA